MRYRHNPQLDLDAARQQIREWKMERNSIENRIDVLGVSRFREPSIDAMWAEVRELDNKIDAKQAEIDAMLEQHRLAEEALKGPEQLDLPFTSRANPSRHSRNPFAPRSYR